MPLKQEKIDIAATLADTLFVVARRGSMADICSLRATCTEWRRTIDSTTSNSEEWRAMACAALGAAPHLSAPGNKHDWIEAARVLSRSPSSSTWLASSCMGLGSLSVSPAAVESLLGWFVAAAEVAAVDCQVTFGTVLNGEGRSQASLAVYTACSQKPPHNMQAQVYSWWLHHAFEIVATIRTRMARADDAAQQRTRASFQSFVKQMASIVLPYLDRFYVRRYEVAGDTSSSLPTVREIGRRAVALLELPFDAPLPADEPCPEVPICAPPHGGVPQVDEAARSRSGSAARGTSATSTASTKFWWRRGSRPSAATSTRSAARPSTHTRIECTGTRRSRATRRRPMTPTT